jgi:hypothetical protein
MSLATLVRVDDVVALNPAGKPSILESLNLGRQRWLTTNLA